MSSESFLWSPSYSIFRSCFCAFMCYNRFRMGRWRFSWQIVLHREVNQYDKFVMRWWVEMVSGPPGDTPLSIKPTRAAKVWKIVSNVPDGAQGSSRMPRTDRLLGGTVPARNRAGGCTSCDSTQRDGATGIVTTLKGPMVQEKSNRVMVSSAPDCNTKQHLMKG